MTTDVLLAYGRFLRGAGRTAEAEPLLREAYDTRRRTLGDGEHPDGRSGGGPRPLPRGGGQDGEGQPLLCQRRAGPGPYPWRTPLGEAAGAVRASR